MSVTRHKLTQLKQTAKKWNCQTKGHLMLSNFHFKVVLFSNFPPNYFMEGSCDALNIWNASAHEEAKLWGLAGARGIALLTERILGVALLLGSLVVHPLFVSVCVCGFVVSVCLGVFVCKFVWACCGRVCRGVLRCYLCCFGVSRNPFFLLNIKDMQLSCVFKKKKYLKYCVV